jgi:hypothetical protein
VRQLVTACVAIWAACDASPMSRDGSPGTADATILDAAPRPDARPATLRLETDGAIRSLWVDAPDVFVATSPPTCPLEGPEICYPPVPLLQHGSLADSTVTTLVEGLYPAADAEASAAYVYYAQATDVPGGTEIRRIARAGGAATTVVPDTALSTLAIDDTYIYWLGNREIMRSDLDGTNPTRLAAWASYPSLAPAGDRLYYADQGVPAILSVARDGGSAPVVVADGVAGPLKHHAGYLYWTAVVSQNAVAIFRVPVDGGEPQTVFAGEYGLLAFDVDDEHVYWANQARGWIKRVPVGGGPVTLLIQDIGQTNMLAVDDDSIYWALYRGIYSIPK